MNFGRVAQGGMKEIELDVARLWSARIVYRVISNNLFMVGSFWVDVYREVRRYVAYSKKRFDASAKYDCNFVDV